MSQGGATKAGRRAGVTRTGVLLLVVLNLVACGSRRSSDELWAALTIEGDPAGRMVATPTPRSLPGPDVAGPVPGQPVEEPTGDATGAVATAAPLESAEPTSEAIAPVPGGTPPSASPPPQGPPVRIGTVGPLSGLVGATLKPGVDGLRVWVQWINDNGGLNGHPVELFVEDDGADPSRHRSLVQQLVDERGVVAFVHNGEALSGAGSISFHQDRQIPVIGSEGASQYFYEHSMYFPQMSHGEHLSVMGLGAFSTWATANDRTRFGAILCQEAQICSDAARLNEEYADDFGLELVYQGRASLAKPDFTAECLNAQSAGVELLAIGMDINSLSRIAASCARQGYYPAYATSSAGAAPKHASDPNIPELVLSSPVAPFTLTEIAGVAQFREAFEQYAPDVEPQLGHMTGWTAGKLLERAGSRIVEPTTGAILEGLWSIRGEDLGGLTSPLAFGPGSPASPATCWWTVLAREGSYSSPFGAQARCSDVLGGRTNKG